MADLAQQLGQILMYGAVAGLLGTFGWCLLEGFRESRAWGRLDRRIGEIGRDQARGVVERLDVADVRRRAAEGRR